MSTDKVQHAERLPKIAITVWDYTDAVVEELEELNYGNYGVKIEIDSLQEILQDADEYRVSDFWYSRFRGGCCYWGILTAWPWDGLTERLGEEESIWAYIIKYHMAVDSKTWKMQFKYNPESKINGWLKHYSTTSDVIYGVELIFKTYLKYVIANQRDRLFTFIENEEEQESEDEE